MEHLRHHAIFPDVFDGIDGEISGLDTRLNVDDTDPESLPKRRRWIGCYLSHYMLWKVCSYQPQDVFFIFEDDVRLEPDWEQHIESALEAIPSDWDMLFIGSCCTADKDTKVQVSDRLWRIQYANCTHAYAIRKKALPILLDKLQAVKTGVDIAISLEAMPFLNVYAILPSLAFQEGMTLPP